MELSLLLNVQEDKTSSLILTVRLAAGSYWYYAPNKGAPIAFAILFALSFCVHVWNCIYYKAWKLCGLLTWSTAILVGGYATRAAGAWNDDNLGLYIASTVLLVLGPPVYAAHLYLVLGRTMYYVPWLAPIHPGRVITTFIGLDVICEVILASGISRVANSSISHTEREVGEGLLKAGLIMQVVMFLFFLALAVFFHHRCSQSGVASKIRGIMIVVYITSLLILERSIYRVVEYFQGYRGTIYTSEPLFWVFEASAMLIVSGILNISSPARLLPESNKVYLSTDGATERLGPGWEDKRPFILTLVDPFDLGSLYRRNAAHNKFWESNEGPVVNTNSQAKDLEAAPTEQFK